LRSGLSALARSAASSLPTSARTPGLSTSSTKASDVTHRLAGAFEQACRILQVDASLEHQIDVVSYDDQVMLSFIRFSRCCRAPDPLLIGKILVARADLVEDAV
jgi:hypothetical protein